jgi:DNA-binding helix-hairpin-helix protein with protein kinase domain
MTVPPYVVDSQGVKYTLGKRLGSGAQGSVFEVVGGRYAVKILNGSSESTLRQVEARCFFLKQLDLGGIPIAQPLSVLRPPYAGYVMNLLKDMMPIGALLRPPLPCASVQVWYRETGGIKRRLECVASAADAVAALHARGLCYGDVSPANILVSASRDLSDVFLIDADNIHYESGIPPRGFYTPGYGAPEIVNRSGTVTSLSDAHSIAVLAFQALTQLHPLIGDLVHDGDPDLETRALAGELPWIDHPDDRSNRATRGLPRESVLSPGLRQLTHRAFTQGLKDRGSRPSAGEWADGLRLAARNCLVCKACGGSYFREEPECIWCGILASPFVHLMVHTQLKDTTMVKDRRGQDRLDENQVVSEGETIVLRQGTALGPVATERQRPVVRFRNDGKSLTIERLDLDAHIEIVLGVRSGHLRGPVTIELNRLRDLKLRFGPEGSIRRVLSASLHVREQR